MMTSKQQQSRGGRHPSFVALFFSSDANCAASCSVWACLAFTSCCAARSSSARGINCAWARPPVCINAGCYTSWGLYHTTLPPAQQHDLLLLMFAAMMDDGFDYSHMGQAGEATFDLVTPNEMLNKKTEGVRTTEYVFHTCSGERGHQFGGVGTSKPRTTCSHRRARRDGR